MLLRARFGISFFLDEPVLTASVGPVPVSHFDSSFFLEGVVLTASEGAYSGCWMFPWDRTVLLPAMWARRTLASKFCQLPGISRSEGMDQSLRCKLCFRRALSSSILQFKKVGTKFTQLKKRITSASAPSQSPSQLRTQPPAELRAQLNRALSWFPGPK